MHDLDEALELHRSVLELHPSEHPERSSLLCGLAHCFMSRYKNQRVVADLEEVVTLGREVLARYPLGTSLILPAVPVVVCLLELLLMASWEVLGTCYDA